MARLATRRLSNVQLLPGEQRMGSLSPGRRPHSDDAAYGQRLRVDQATNDERGPRTDKRPPSIPPSGQSKAPSALRLCQAP